MRAFPPVTLLLGICLACSLTAAKPVPVEKEADKRGPVLTSELIGSGDAEMNGGGLEYRYVGFYQANWTLAQTIPIQEASTLTFSLGYNLGLRHIDEPSDLDDDDDWPEFTKNHPYWNNIPLPKKLQSLVGSFEYFHPLDEKWAFSASLCQGSYVTSKGLLSDGWGTSASIVAMYAWSPDINLAFGAAYDSLSHDYRLVPIIGIAWNLSEKWSLSIGFPSTALSYKLSKKYWMSLEATGSGGTYFVKDDPAPGLAPRSLADSMLENTEVRLGYRFDWHINRTFSVSATSGYVLYREFKYIGRDFKLKSGNISSFGAISGSISF
ncbi:MAG: hypothetical protein IPP19_02330 [Verrucomicrobia bacterium]|nr:hypothetical protein [Verrucomicrobiota bacterium]